MTKLLAAIFLFMISAPAMYAFSLGERDELCLNYGDYSNIQTMAVGYKYVYFLTDNGIIRYDINESQWAEPISPMIGVRPTIIYDFFVTFDDANIWLSTDLGIFMYSETMNSWSSEYELPEGTTKIRSVTAEDQFFAPWDYTYLPGGILLDRYDRRFYLRRILDDGWGHLWLAIDGLGPALADKGSRQIELMTYGLIQNDIVTLGMDNNHQLWMGGQANLSYRSGATRFDIENNNFEHLEFQGTLLKKPNHIQDITFNEYNVFLATDDGVRIVGKSDPNQELRLDHHDGLPDDNILTLLMVGNRLYIGSEFGLVESYISGDTLETIGDINLPSVAILAMEVVGDDIWIGTSRGLYRLNRPTGNIGLLSIPEISETAYINDIKFDGRLVWLATDYDIVSINIKNADINIYHEVSNYGGARAIDISDTLIAAATTQGLLLISTGRNAYHELFTVENGLPSDNINDLIFDPPFLWLGTDSGLCRFYYLYPDL